MSEGGYRTGPAHRGPSAIRLVWVYPDLLSTYGDRGNLLVLARRARLHGFGVEVAEVNSDQRVPVDGDIYLLGGGEDLPQILAARRLAAGGPRGGLAAAAARGAEGEPVAGLGLLDISSGRGERRGVGEIVADVDPALGAGRLTGFENHQGVTRRGPGAKPLATVVTGVGNGDGTEGAYAGRVAGTYLHGPALVRNPGLADMLLGWVTGPLPPVDPRQEGLVQQLRAERLAAQGASAVG
jgi:CobQ-like glutamine amidotransferase family enzyme